MSLGGYGARSRVDPDAAYARAEELITEAKRTGATELDFGFTLGALEKLPPAISSLNKLKKLDLRYTKVRDLTPLEKLLGLEAVNLYRTKDADITSLAALANLTELHLNATRVKDLPPPCQTKKFDIPQPQQIEGS